MHTRRKPTENIKNKIYSLSLNAKIDFPLRVVCFAYCFDEFGLDKTPDKQSYNEPRFVVTDDKLFGNKISKPRLCVAVTEDSKLRVMLAPVVKRTTKTMNTCKMGK